MLHRLLGGLRLLCVWSAAAIASVVVPAFVPALVPVEGAPASGLAWAQPQPADARCGPGAAGATCDGAGPASQGAAAPTEQGVGNPIHLMTGNKYQRDSDLPALPGVLGVEIVRHYNSAFSQVHQPVRAAGRGWRFSYETELYRVGAGLQIVQADGTRLIFARTSHRSDRGVAASASTAAPVGSVVPVTAVCTSPDPQHGRIEVRASPHGETYVWHWPTGRRLHFDHAPRLVSIEETTGEILRLEYDAIGRLVRVVDPQARSLRLHYVEASPLVAMIESPVGRFHYRYAGHQNQSLVESARTAPDGRVRLRQYQYADPRFPALLTGIEDQVREPGGELLRRPIARFEYDAQARAVMSESHPEIEARGAPSSPAQTPERLRLAFTRPALPTGAEGLTVVTNALGEVTRYRFAIIASQYRLLSAEGPGCERCGPGNVRYRYDRLGRLAETTWLRQDLRPWVGERRTLDAQGRLRRIERIDYSAQGVARAVELSRHEYEDGPRDARAKGPPGVLGGPARVISIFRPSVLPGREASLRIAYTPTGEIESVEERGWSPGAEGLAPAALLRRQRFDYAEINGRRVLSTVDGPLPNGPQGTPVDSDVQRFEYDEQGRLVGLWLPGDRRRQFRFDEAGRVNEALEIDADRHTRIRIERDGGGSVLRLRRKAWRESAPGQVDAATVLEQTVEHEFDPFERVVGERIDGRLERQVERDQASRPVRIKQADGGELALRYGAENRIEAMLREPGFGVPGQHIRYTHQLGIVHDGMTLATMADDLGLIHSFEADPSGRRLQGRSDALGQFTRWDALALPDGAEVVRRSLAAVKLRYDLRGGLIEVAEPAATGGRASEGAVALLAVAVDDFGRRVRFESPAHGTVHYVWDAADRLSAVVDQGFNIRRIEHDLRGRPLRVHGPDSRRTLHFDYLGSDLVARRVEGPDGGVDVFADGVGKRDATAASSPPLSGAHGPRPIQLTERRRYRYDSFGRLVNEMRETERVDVAGRFWTLQIDTAYEGSGRRVRSRILTDAAGRRHVFEQRHREDGSLAAVVLDGRVIVDEVRVASLAGLVTLRHGNGLVERLTRTSRNRLATIEVGMVAGGQMAPLSRIDLRYDALDRLISSAGLGPWGSRQEQYRYLADGRPVPISEGLTATMGDGRTLDRQEIDARARLRVDAQGGLSIARLDPGGRADLLRGLDGRARARYAFGLDGERLAREVGDELRYGVHLPGPRGPRLEAEVDRNGRIVAHYVYVDATPVARVVIPGGDPRAGAEFRPLDLAERLQVVARRWLPADTRMPALGAMRVFAIHCDQRRAPYMVTDETGQVVWLGRSDIRGRTEVELRTPHPFRMDLRLAGQVFDEESGTHTQHRRDYDPVTGRFLAADPLSTDAGLPLNAVLQRAGLDPTLYAGGDPLTRSDPTGLYEEDVHYYVQFFLALAAGLPARQAHLMALGNRYVDDNPYTEPYGLQTGSLGYPARLQYHFTGYGADPARLPGESDADYDARRLRNPSNPALDALHALAMGATDPCTRAYLYGEYGHAYMDTFAHRDQDNEPYNPLTGHLSGGHSPDQTYNHDDALWWTDLSGGVSEISVPWRVNADRTLAMEEDLFNRIQQDFGTHAVDRDGNRITWERISAVMAAFNAQEMRESDARIKADLLRAALRELGLPDRLQPYNCADGRAGRAEFAPGAGGFQTPSAEQPPGVQSSPTCR